MRSELIGLEVEVRSPNHGTKDFAGTVVDETRNTFVIHDGVKDIVVPKRPNEFTFTYQGEKVMVRGEDVAFRPEDRIKRIR